MDDDISTGTDELERILSGSKSPDKLKLSVLRHITENFSDKRKIGQGGCGVVYKGILPSGQAVAVKKLFSNKTYDDRMFQQEVTAMMMVEHQNTVRFLGYCSHIEERAIKISGKYILAEERERLLCFDYISKGSLHDYVTDELRGFEWHIRFQIIKGICEGLHHLHKEKGIIHMDLKPANILLDNDLVPKITDFGISRPGEISVTMSKERLFSLGYCAPEYQFSGKMSFKSDIYGLGVIIREMVTGIKEPDITTVHRRWMHRWKKSATARHTALGYQQQVTECLELAERCMHRYPIKRPDIQDVIYQLNEMDRAAASHINGANNSFFEQKITCSFSEDMLGIEPLQLHFPVAINKQTSRSILLTNDTDDYIAFRVLPGSQFPCCIHPSNDIVPPRSICSVTIALEVLQNKPLPEVGIEEFYVQSTRVNEGLTIKDILETEEMFEEEPDKIVDMVNLTASMCAPKQYPLIVQPPELRFPTHTLEPNKFLLPFSMQLANMTDDYVAFMFVMPDEKVTHYSYQLAVSMGIMPPWSTRGVVIDVQAKEDEVVLPLGTRPMQWKDTAVVQSVVLGTDSLISSVDHISQDLFCEETDVHELELDIVFGPQPESQPQPSSSACSPLMSSDQDWEVDAQEEFYKLHASTAQKIISPFSIETELLQIYPSELRFTFGEGTEYISLINKTDEDVIYFIDYDNQEYRIRGTGSRGVVPPHSTCSVPVFAYKKPCGVYIHVFRILMIGGRHYRITKDLFDESDHLKIYDNKRDEMINKVRADGGKAHEALLMSVLHVRHHPDQDSTPTKQNKEIRMDENGLERVLCMDVHPTEPWVVTCHNGSCCACIWKMGPQISAYQKTLSTGRNSTLISSVKFIARMQWVAYGNFNGFITVRTYVDTLTEIKSFRAENDKVTALAVHPTHPYLLSCSKDNMIKAWDWDQGWMCAKKFSYNGEGICSEGVLRFNPNDDKTFASVSTHGYSNKCDIKVWNMDSNNPHIILPVKGGATSLVYCITGSDRQYMAAADSQGKIEILDLQSKTHVHTFEALEANRMMHPRWSLACHPVRPLLAAVYKNSVVWWNYTTYRLEKAHVNDTLKYSSSADIKGLGFVAIEGIQRLVIAYPQKIEMVDIFYGLMQH